MPSQRETIARPKAPNVRETGPAPLRTARGAGRFAAVLPRPDRADADLPRTGLVVGRLELALRDRVFELFVVALPEAPERDVLELREPGGEDVRVAMLRP